MRPTKYVPDDSFYVDVQVYVDSNGIFYCSVPEHLKNSLSKITGKLPNESTLTVEYDELKKIKNSNYESLLKDLQLFHDAYSQPVLTRRLVIAYQVISDVAYAVDDALNIHKTNESEGTSWSEFANKDKIQLNYFDSGNFGLKLAAKVLAEVKYTYGDTTEIKYESPNDEEMQAYPSISELNKWQGIKLDPSDKNKSVNVIDYTEESAKFFDDMLLWMVTVSDKLERFFSKPDHVHLMNNAFVNTNLIGFN